MALSCVLSRGRTKTCPSDSNVAALHLYRTTCPWARSGEGLTKDSELSWALGRSRRCPDACGRRRGFAQGDSGDHRSVRRRLGQALWVTVGCHG